MQPRNRCNGRKQSKFAVGSRAFDCGLVGLAGAVCAHSEGAPGTAAGTNDANTATRRTVLRTSTRCDGRTAQARRSSGGTVVGARGRGGFAPNRACSVQTGFDTDTPISRGRFHSPGGASTTSFLTKYRETVSPDSPNVTLFSPSGSQKPYYAEYGWVGDGTAKIKLPTAQDRVDRPFPRASETRFARETRMGQRRGSDLSPDDLYRRQLSVQRRAGGGEQQRKPGHALSLRPDFTSRATGSRKLLHPARGSDRRFRRGGIAGDRLRRRDRRQGHRLQECQGRVGSASRTSIGPPSLSRTRRRRIRPAISGTVPQWKGPLSDRLSCLSGSSAGRRQGVNQGIAVRRRKGSRRGRSGSRKIRHRPVRPADRLGLVLLS